MNHYPSAASVPPAMWHRTLLAMWGGLSLMVVGLFGWQAISQPDAIGASLSMIGVGLLYASTFGMAGLFLRKRYTDRLQARQAFLDRLGTDGPER